MPPCGETNMPGRSQTFEVEAQSDSLPILRKELGSLLEATGFSAREKNDLLLSVDEVLTNVIRHGYRDKTSGAEKGKISLLFSDLEDRVEIKIEDKAPCFDPRKVPSPVLPSEKPGGLGIHLVRSLMDEIHYEALKPKGNRLRLIKYKGEKKGNMEK